MLTIGVASAFLLIVFVPGWRLNLTPDSKIAFNTPSSMSSNVNKTAHTFVMYHNPRFNISMLEPVNWTIHENGTRLPNSTYTDIVSFTGPSLNQKDTVLEQVDIQSDDISNEKNVTLAQYTNDTSNSIRDSMNDYKLIYSSANNTLSGNHAYAFVYTGNLGVAGNNNYIQGLVVISITGVNAYIINYYAEAPTYSSHLPTVLKMINSFHFD
jgi:hypothetical protein